MALFNLQGRWLQGNFEINIVMTTADEFNIKAISAELQKYGQLVMERCTSQENLKSLCPAPEAMGTSRDTYQPMENRCISKTVLSGLCSIAKAIDHCA
jgi:hypothetical protein